MAGIGAAVVAMDGVATEEAAKEMSSMILMSSSSANNLATGPKTVLINQALAPEKRKRTEKGRRQVERKGHPTKMKTHLLNREEVHQHRLKIKIH